MPDDAIAACAYVKRVQTEILEEAQQRRESYPSLVTQEPDIHEAWTGSAAVVSSKVTSPGELEANAEHLFGCVTELSLLSVDAPIEGTRRGIRQLKGATRKLVGWYMRYLAGQINAFNHSLVRLLQSTEQRIARLESYAQAAGAIGAFVDPVPDADPVLARAVADQLSKCDGSVAVVSCGNGQIVLALVQAGISAHGVDDSAGAISVGVNEGLDLRVATAREHLGRLADDSLAGVVLTKFAERSNPVELSILVDEALRCVGLSGRVVVAVTDPGTRSGPTAELLSGVGLSPETWAHMLSKRGCTVELSELTGSRVTTLVTAQRQ